MSGHQSASAKETWRLSKTREGHVVSAKMQKTVKVEIRSKVPHPVFKKYVTRCSTFMAHDAKGECQVGDKVLITETRPLSKNKRWTVSKIINRAVETRGEEV